VPLSKNLSSQLIVIHERDGKDATFLNGLNATVTRIHLAGQPRLWLIKIILVKCPNLVELQLIPSQIRELKGESLKLLQQRKIKITAGHFKPQSSGHQAAPTSSYLKEQRFMMELSERQNALFKELLALNFEHALMAQRYFCLDGKSRESLVAICSAYSISTISNISAKIRALLYYLDRSFKCSKTSVRIARTLEQRVAKARDQKRKKQDMLNNLVYPKYSPKSLRPRCRFIIDSFNNGSIERLQTLYPLGYEVLKNRYHPNNEVGNRFTSMAVVAKTMGYSRQGIGLIERKACAILKAELT